MRANPRELEVTQELDEAQLAAVETDFVESFEDEPSSSADETQEFTYFVEEIMESEQTEISEIESSEEAAEVQFEAVSDEMIFEEDFQNADENDSDEKFEEAAVEAEESLSHQELSENLTEENNQETDHPETEQPQEVFAADSEDYTEEDFASNEEADADVFAINSDEVFASSGMSENGFHATMPAEAISVSRNDRRGDAGNAKFCRRK